MEDEVLKQISKLEFGDFIEVEWWDHSKREIRLKPRGKKRYLMFDVPVRSVGIFFGVAGEEAKHIVLIRDIFVWPSMGDFDIDSTAILLGVTKSVRVIGHGLLDSKISTQLEAAWERGQVRIVKRGKDLFFYSSFDETLQTHNMTLRNFDSSVGARLGEAGSGQQLEDGCLAAQINLVQDVVYVGSS